MSPRRPAPASERLATTRPAVTASDRVAVERWIEENDVERRPCPFEKSPGAVPVQAQTGGAGGEGATVLFEAGESARVLLYQVDLGRAARVRLEAQRAAAGEEIEAA